MDHDTTSQRYSELKAEGGDMISIIRVLRKEFGLSVEQAKEVVIRCEEGKSLSEYQESLLEPLKRALED